MHLEHDERVALRRTGKQLRRWQFQRALNAVVAIAALLFSFWLSYANLEAHELRWIAMSLATGIAVGLLAQVISTWRPDAEKLLIKFAKQQGLAAE